MTDQNVLITGGAGFIGKATSFLLGLWDMQNAAADKLAVYIVGPAKARQPA